MELRCAHDDYLTEWGDSEFIFNVTYYRSTPYDPTRPWIDTDGKWYMLVGIDACNATTRKLPCEEGAGVMLYVSDQGLRGPKANWRQVGIAYKTPDTVLPTGRNRQEMVTIDYLGGLRGDPFEGQTRVLFDNVGGNGGWVDCCSGTTSYTVVRQESPGAVLAVNKSSNFNGVGMVDWGSFPIKARAGLFGLEALGPTVDRVYSMARTLGSEEQNHVLGTGRKVMFAWLKENPNAILSLGRDLSLDENLTLLQAFVPELQALRLPGTHAVLSPDSLVARVGMHAEIYAEFTNLVQAQTKGLRMLGINVLQCDENEFTRVGVHFDHGLAFINGLRQMRDFPVGGPLVFGGRGELRKMDRITMHVYIDGGMIEMIVNNRTALSFPVVPSSSQCGIVSLAGLRSAAGTHVKARVDVWVLKGSWETISPI